MSKTFLEGQIIGVCDLLFGDSGKGHVVDWLLGFAAAQGNPIDIVVRATGSHNAGHCVVNDRGTFRLNAIPSAICYPEVVKVCGNGMVINPLLLVEEIHQLREQSVDLSHNFLVSDRATMILPWYRALEELLELSRACENDTVPLGTTGKAVGIAYAKRCERSAASFSLLKDKRALRKKIDNVAWIESKIIDALKILLRRGLKDPSVLDAVEDPDPHEVFENYARAADVLGPHLNDSIYFLHKACDEGKRILLEGAQGIGLDIDLGTYPFVTSTNTGRAGMMAGSGLGRIDTLFGVSKAYATRVGNGYFPSEIFGNEAHTIQRRGNEYGTTTGRLRRVGCRDLIYERYAVTTNAVDATIVTKIDVLDGFPTLYAATIYLHNGKILRHMPSDPNENTTALCEVFGGFHHATQPGSFLDIKESCRTFLDFCQKEVGVPLFAVSFGPHRDDIFTV